MALDRDELEAWLGNDVYRLDDAQVDRLHAEAEEIERRWPGPEYAPERDAALEVTVRWLLGQVTTMTAGAQLQEAQDCLSVAQAVARQTARLAVLDGETAEQAAVEAGVDPGLLRRDVAG